MATDDAHVDAFGDARPGLLGLAHRLLGSRAEAEDAVQETFLRWSLADRADIAAPAAWMAAVCTRYCLDVLRNAHHTRVCYVGSMLPEPLHVVDEQCPARVSEMTEAVAIAFLALLERLSPKERAAYLLHEIFELGYGDVAATLGMNEPACRQLVSRARAHLERGHVRYAPPADRQVQLLAAFQHAVGAGDTTGLTVQLASDLQRCVGGEAKVAVPRREWQRPHEASQLRHRGRQHRRAPHGWSVSC